MPDTDTDTDTDTGVATVAPVPQAADLERSRETSAARRLMQISIDVVAKAMVMAWQSRSRPVRSGPLHRV